MQEIVQVLHVHHHAATLVAMSTIVRINTEGVNAWTDAAAAFQVFCAWQMKSGIGIFTHQIVAIGIV